MDHVTFGLKSEILREVDKDIEVLETRLMVKMNEAHQTMATRLQEIKDSVMVVGDSQWKMWRVIKRMSKELQELVRGMLVLIVKEK